MVRWQHQHDRLGAEAIPEYHRGGSDGRCGIAAERLKQIFEPRGAGRQFGILVPGKEIVVPIRDSQHHAHIRKPLHPAEGPLQQAPPIMQLDERFGQRLS